MRKRLADRRLTLELTDSARELIARPGYDPVYEARPLRRFVQCEVETRIAGALLAGEILDGATMIVEREGRRAPSRLARPRRGGRGGGTRCRRS